MYKVFEIKSDNENKSYPKAIIRYDMSEILENEVNDCLELVNQGELGENTQWMRLGDDGVGSLYALMGLETFMAYITSKSREDLDDLIKKNKLKNDIIELVDNNDWTPQNLKKDLEKEINNWVNQLDSHPAFDIEEELNNLLSDPDFDGNKYWYIEGRNLGWRNRSGHKFAKISNGSEFMSEILPNTECTFYIEKNEDKTLTLYNYHHDAPTGESYTLTCMNPKVVLEMYKGKDHNHDLSELLDNSHSSDFKTEDSLALFNEAIKKDSSDDIETLLRYGFAPDTEDQAVDSIALAAGLDCESALRSYISQASLFNNEKRSNKIVQAAIDKSVSDDAKKLLKQWIKE